ncbi:MAG TPA: hypothetical protein VFP65_27500 [Anaeromyxobacteraceae bacterium]|nr:hypothetical protein [Anaeromyxobacteraceae bacterium]
MIAKRIALAAVVLAVGGIVAFKATRSTSPATARASAVAPASHPAVVLVADGREADSDCDCGRIIRRVRAAKAVGVAVEEFAPDDPGAARRYGVTVVPTVLVLDGDGKVIARREGESAEILAAISSDLAKLESARR